MGVALIHEDTDGETDRRPDATKVTGTFSD